MKRVAAMLAILLSAAPIAEAAERGANDPVEQYNAGTAQYRREAYPKAEEALRRSVASAQPWLQGKAAYNLASAQYRQGIQAALKEPDKAQQLLAQALDNYRLALRRNPRDANAQYNYELTRKHLDALKQRQEQQKQQQQENKKSEEQQAKEQAAQEQKAQSQASEEKQEQQQAEVKSEEDKKKEDKPKEAKELSEQQALWILDNMQREEYGARADGPKQPAQESNVDQDW